MSDLRRKMATGAVWMVLFKLLDKSIGLLSTLLLARLLLPADFGLVAMAGAFIAMLEALGAFGLEAALIQRQSSTRTHFDTAWTLNVSVGMSTALLLLALSIPISRFYGEPALVQVIWALALAAAIQGFENVGIVLFRKELDFARDFRFLLGKRCVSFLVTVPLALWLRSYWALVIGTVAARAAGVALSYVMHSYRPRLTLGALADLFHFSKWMLLVNCLSFLRERSADFVVGRLAGPHALGIFSVSAELANMPGTELIAPINRAVFPAYARLAHDPEALRTEYLSVMGIVGLLAIPAVAGMAATAPLIVPVILGPNWLDAQVILTILAFFGITQVVQSNAFSAYMALGRPDILARLTASHVIVLLTLLISLTVWKGVIGAAFAYLITALIMVPLTFAFLFPRLQLTTRRFARVVWRPMLASAVMFAVVREFIDELAGAGAGTPILALVLIAAIIVGMVTYVAAIAVLWVASGRPDGAERVSGQRVQHFLRTALAFARARLLSVGQGRGE